MSALSSIERPRATRAAALAALLCLFAAPALAAESARPLTAWRAYGGTGMPATWSIAGGVITHTPGGGDLISVETFASFEFAFDWKIAPGGNSGIMYRVDEQFGAPYQSGPEYQILDNAGHSDGNSPLTSAASCYGLYAPAADLTKPAGEWNTGKIVVDGAHVEHWLNGTKVLDYDLGSADWKARVAASSFAAWPHYGALPSGHIDLQDHGAEVAFRNLTIRPLPGG